MTSLVFRVAAGVVNTAARAANGLLEVMYPPRYDAAHIWDEPQQETVDSLLTLSHSFWCRWHEGVTGRCPSDCSERVRREQEALDRLAAPCADPHPAAGVADPAGGTPPPPAGSLTWEGWAIPAILDVLADHQLFRAVESGRWVCHDGGAAPCDVFEYQDDWRDHVAPLIAKRIACDPTRAALALTSLQKQ